MCETKQASQECCRSGVATHNSQDVVLVPQISAADVGEEALAALEPEVEAAAGEAARPVHLYGR